MHCQVNKILLGDQIEATVVAGCDHFDTKRACEITYEEQYG